MIQIKFLAVTDRRKMQHLFLFIGLYANGFAVNLWKCSELARHK